MSLHHRLVRPHNGTPDLLDPRWVTRHRGDLEDFMARHRRQSSVIVREGRSALSRIAPSLLHRVSHDKVLRFAWNYLQANGGQSPGSDGWRYSDIPNSEVWRLCRELRDEIRSERYTPDADRIVKISKGPGRGNRPLAIQSIFDRVVQRAVVEIVQPILDPHFDIHSFGFRPGKSHLHALVTAETFCFEQGRTVWALADLKDAFASIPLPRLLDVVRRYLIADDLVQLIGRIIGGSSQQGLRQGGCLSPLLLNLYLDHFLDKPWRRLNPDTPLIRYADDILLPCRSRAEARETLGMLADVLRPTGMVLKADKTGVKTLTAHDPADWMGFLINRSGDRLQYGLANSAWSQLAENVILAHDESNSPVQVYEMIVGWIGQKGPCYPDLDHDGVYAEIAAIAGEHGFDEIPGRSEISNLWERAHERWRGIQA